MYKQSLLGFILCIGMFFVANLAHAEQTMSCSNGTYDMLDWMTLDSDLRATQHLGGNANPIYTTMEPDKFYWTKGGNGSPWDIQLYDKKYIYLWITEYSWNDPNSYKKSDKNTNEPFAPRCASGGFPGWSMKIPDTSYQMHTSCNSSTYHTLKQGVNEIWGPYDLSFGGSLPDQTPTLVASYRYNCDSNYGSCGDKEEFYLQKRYGLVQWVHYTLLKGSYKEQQRSVFNQLKSGTTVPSFPCF